MLLTRNDTSTGVMSRLGDRAAAALPCTTAETHPLGSGRTIRVGSPNHNRQASKQREAIYGFYYALPRLIPERSSIPGCQDPDC